MSARRLSGFIDYCNDHGLPYQQLRMQGTSEVEGMLQLRAWAGSLGEDRVGVFTAIDHTGNILTKIAQEEGIPVPERLGIIGCGDMTKLHVFAQIPLTSVGIPWVELGFQAGILAREALAGLPARDVLISPSGIITRKSTDAHATTDTFGRRVWLDLQTHLKDIPTVSELARRNHVGERQFTRRIWECFGCSPANLISKARVERARQMLVSSHATIDVIAEACGLSSARALQKIFLRETGLPPTAFRAQVRSAEPQPADPLQGVTAAVFPKRTP
jgi:AraC-like DNA-binding protein